MLASEPDGSAEKRKQVSTLSLKFQPFSLLAYQLSACQPFSVSAFRLFPFLSFLTSVVVSTTMPAC